MFTWSEWYVCNFGVEKPILGWARFFAWILKTRNAYVQVMKETYCKLLIHHGSLLKLQLICYHKFTYYSNSITDLLSYVNHSFKLNS